MTTIVFDGKRLVADTLRTSAGFKLPGDFTKIWLPGSATWKIQGVEVMAVGFSGSCSFQMELKEKLLENLTHKTKFTNLEGGFTLLCYMKTGNVFHVHYHTSTKNTTGYTAITDMGNSGEAVGSGSSYALGALSMGCDAAEAVIAAINVSTSTGGNLCIWNPKKPHKLKFISPKKYLKKKVKKTKRKETWG